MRQYQDFPVLLRQQEEVASPNPSTPIRSDYASPNPFQPCSHSVPKNIGREETFAALE
jgi:hypothetical protein